MNYQEIMEAGVNDEWFEVPVEREYIEIALEAHVAGYRGICMMNEDSELEGYTWTGGTCQNPESKLIIVYELTDQDLDFPDGDLFDEDELEKIRTEYDYIPCAEESAKFLKVDLKERFLNAILS